MDLSGVLDIVRLTDIGQWRNHNEDATVGSAESGLVVLADGMGGHNAGEIASELAVLSLLTEMREELSYLPAGSKDLETGLLRESCVLRDAVARTNMMIYNISQSRQECSGMGTTLVAALFADNKICVGHIGDSRLYRMRANDFQQMTEDHSLCNEHLKAGLISPQQVEDFGNKNLIVRALGVSPEVELELNEYNVSAGDIYLLCSDGLSDQLQDEDMLKILNEFSDDLQLAAHRLVQMANDRGGVDNISVILVRLLKPFPAAKARWIDRLISHFR